jgi:GNAT superfamily N-acetyltransferase
MFMDFEELTTPGSLQIIRDIAQSIWPETFSSILSPEQIKYMMNMMYAPEVMEKELAGGCHFEIVKIDHTPAGYFSWSPYSGANTAKLHKLYLLSDFHGKGIGSAMLRQVEKRVANAGFTVLKLNVNKYNERAKKAYLRNGFTIEEAVKIDIGNGFFMDDFVMVKKICR